MTRVEFTTKAIRDIEGAFERVLGRAAAAALRATDEPTPAGDEQQPAPIHLEPWHIFDPRRQTVCAGYVDDANQQRWVPVADETGVPKAWRKLYMTRDA